MRKLWNKSNLTKNWKQYRTVTGTLRNPKLGPGRNSMKTEKLNVMPRKEKKANSNLLISMKTADADYIQQRTV